MHAPLPGGQQTVERLRAAQADVGAVGRSGGKHAQLVGRAKTEQRKGVLAEGPVFQLGLVIRVDGRNRQRPRARRKEQRRGKGNQRVNVGAARAKAKRHPPGIGRVTLDFRSPQGHRTTKEKPGIHQIHFRVTAALAQDNRLPTITANMDKTTANLARVSESLNKTVQSGSLDRSVTKLEKIIDKVDRGEGTLGALINDRSIHERLKSILGAGQKSQQVKNILKSSVEE